MDTIPPLETKMKEHIHPMYRDEIDFTAQMDAFVDTISHTLSIMIAGKLMISIDYFRVLIDLISFDRNQFQVRTNIQSDEED